MTSRTWTRYVALGDSITEGWCDPVVGEGEPWFGWADRLALSIDADRRAAGLARLAFANLAVRGRRVHHVVDDQVPVAIEHGAELVSILVGGNDLLSLRSDPDALAARLDLAVARLRASGATVLLATSFDPGDAPVLRVLRARTERFNAGLRAIAARRGCLLLDLWGLEVLRDRSAWSEDRIHPSTRGHLVIARAAARRLRLSSIPSAPGQPTTPRHLTTLDWAMRHGLPWLGRRIRRVSSGDGRGPKLPVPTPVAEREGAAH